jgi:hypothetical protein
MTNRELLRTPASLLGELDRQRLFLLRVDGTPMSCPACKRPVNLFDAAGIDVDGYDFGSTKHAYRCPGCAAEVEQVVPFIAGGGPLWHWVLNDAWLQNRLSKARAFEEQHKSKGGSGTVSPPHQ